MPTLKPGDIVIIDNLGSHKGKAVRHAIRSGRRQAVLPAALQPRPQSDRAGLRQAQDAAAQSRRANRRGHLEAHRRTLPAFTPQECANYFETPDTLQPEPIML